MKAVMLLIEVITRSEGRCPVGVVSYGEENNRWDGSSGGGNVFAGLGVFAVLLAAVAIFMIKNKAT